MISELKTENSDLKLYSDLKEQTKFIETKDKIISDKTKKRAKF